MGFVFAYLLLALFYFILFVFAVSAVRLALFALFWILGLLQLLTCADLLYGWFDVGWSLIDCG